MVKLSNKELFYSIVICAITIGPGINYLLNELVQVFLGGESVSALVYILLGVMGIMAYPLLFKKPRNNRIELTIALVTVILIVSAVIHPSLWSYIITDDFNPLKSIGLFLIFYGFPLLILCGKHKEWDLLLKYLFYFSIADIVLAAFAFFYVLLPGGADAGAYMSFSYSQLFPGSICAVYGYRKKRISPFIISIISLLLIFLGGARGPLGCMLFLYILIIVNNFTFKNALPYLVVIVVFVFLAPRLFDLFITSSERVVDDLGGFSRTLYKITEGELFESHARENIKKIIEEASFQNPLGYGLLGDRYIIEQHGNQGYAHSIIWEFICDFGWFLGPVLLLSLLVMIVKTYMRLKFQPIHYCFLAMLPSGFLMLFFSGSFLEEFVFWALLGLLYNSSSLRNKSVV